MGEPGRPRGERVMELLGAVAGLAYQGLGGLSWHHQSRAFRQRRHWIPVGSALRTALISSIEFGKARAPGNLWPAGPRMGGLSPVKKRTDAGWKGGLGDSGASLSADAEVWPRVGWPVAPGANGSAWLPDGICRDGR